MDGTVARFGKLDCAVNNAGIAGNLMAPVADIEEEAWDQVMNVNLQAVWMCMKYEIRAMLKQGIRINVVTPGHSRSEMVDPFVEAVPDLVKAVLNKYSAMNRLGDASEIANATAWLCPDEASFVNNALERKHGKKLR
jgi:A-factor type gamma-butyrolactone 1'-reductase (1S-forming)